jgi:hypothetical protein
MITSFRNFPDGPASNDEHKSARALEANIVQPLSILQYLLIGTSEGPGGALGWVATPEASLLVDLICKKLISHIVLQGG